MTCTKVYGSGFRWALLIAFLILSGIASGRDGDVMAPGAARVVALRDDGAMTVTILERVFSGSWQAVGNAAALPLLRLHWRGKRSELQGRRLARASLEAGAGLSLRCEFVLDTERPSGVCEESGGRLYYLR